MLLLPAASSAALLPVAPQTLRGALLSCWSTEQVHAQPHPGPVCALKSPPPLVPAALAAAAAAAVAAVVAAALQLPQLPPQGV